MAQLALAAVMHGQLGPLDGAWRDWIVRRGALVSPAGECFKPGDLLALVLVRQLADEGQRQARALRQELDQVRTTLAQATAALNAAQDDIARIAAQAPVRVQLVAIDQDGNQTALTAPVAPLMLGRPSEPQAERHAVAGRPNERGAQLHANGGAHGVRGQVAQVEPVAGLVGVADFLRDARNHGERERPAL